MPLPATYTFLLCSRAMGRYQGDDTTGFQSPAQDYVEPTIDLGQILGLRQPGLYPVRFVDQDMRGRGIHAGDILITDAAAAPADGQVCVVFLHGERVLATIARQDGDWWVRRAGRDPVLVSEDVEVWGAVKALVRTKI